MRNARLLGILFLFTGIVISWIYLNTKNEAEVIILKVLLAGPFILGTGIGMVLVPGYTLTNREWKNRKHRLKLIFFKTSMPIIGIWLFLGILSTLLIQKGIINFLFIK